MSEERFIKYGDRTMSMPAEMKLEEAKSIMAKHFPELAENPKIETKKADGKTTYIFSKQAGRKGNQHPVSPVRQIAKNLAHLKAVPVVPNSIYRHALGRQDEVSSLDVDVLHSELVHSVAAVNALLELAPALGAAGEAILL